MKNFIFKGLCFFFITICLFVFMLPSAVSAQSGHGGSTEVIARIETEPASESVPTQPCSVPDAPGDDNPVQTGEAVAWIFGVAAACSGVFLLYCALRKKE